MSRAKELLTELQSLDMDIQSRIDEINELEAGLLLSSKWTDVKVQSGQVKKIDDVYAQLITMKQEIEHDIKEIIDRKLELSRLINKLSNPKYRTVLRMTYINKMYVDDICDKLAISKSSYYSMRKVAIEELEVTLE